MQERHPNLVKLGKRIRKCRVSHGHSQEAIASEAQLDRAYMGRIERGEQNLSFQNLVRIALALKVEIGELVPSLNELKFPR
jgi:transcriptional regulator with XRE-family HTH domain